MRISPRILYSLLPMFMRAPAKMKVLIVVVGAIGFFGWKTLGGAGGGSLGLPSSGQQSDRGRQSNSSLPVDDLSISEALGSPQNSSSNSNVPPAAQLKAGKYERLKNCQLVSDKYNDGDSFKVKTESGELLEVRLYFVDTNESKDKRFEDHKKRVSQQAAYFGNSYEQAIMLGAAAKKHTKEQLSGKKFTVLTKRELVYGGPRIYAFVYLDGLGWWHEHLVKNGLARIHTKGSDMPDGTHWQKRKDILKRFEKEARQAKRGAWGL